MVLGYSTHITLNAFIVHLCEAKTSSMKVVRSPRIPCFNVVGGGGLWPKTVWNNWMINWPPQQTSLPQRVPELRLMHMGVVLTPVEQILGWLNTLWPTKRRWVGRTWFYENLTPDQIAARSLKTPFCVCVCVWSSVGWPAVAQPSVWKIRVKEKSWP